MGYGTGPYGFGPLGNPSPPSDSEAPSDLSSSRKIDGEKRRYVLDDAGGFEPMDDTDQRVLLTLCFADVETKFITPSALREQESRIRRALTDAGLIGGRDAPVELLDLTVERAAPGVTLKSLTYKNRLADTKRTIKAQAR